MGLFVELTEEMRAHGLILLVCRTVRCKAHLNYSAAVVGWKTLGPYRNRFTASFRTDHNRTLFRNSLYIFQSRRNGLGGYGDFTFHLETLVYTLSQATTDTVHLVISDTYMTRHDLIIEANLPNENRP